jgi:hypothetical protein
LASSHNWEDFVGGRGTTETNINHPRGSTGD